MGKRLFLLMCLFLLAGCSMPSAPKSAENLPPLVITAVAPTVTAYTSPNGSTYKQHTPKSTLRGITEQDFPAETPAVTVDPQKLNSFLSLAKKLEGSSYRAGGVTPSEGFDGGGFIYYCLNSVDVSVSSKTTEEHAKNESWTPFYSQMEAQAGDLLFFITGEQGEIDCVALYLGNDKMLYPSVSRNSVITVSSNTEYWKRHFALGRRIFPSA